MKNFSEESINTIACWIIIIFPICIVGLIVYLGTKTLSNTEVMLITIILSIMSIAVTWIISYYYAKNSYGEIMNKVKDENDSKLRVYALKAAEKVDNLSSELERLSLFLRDELNVKYESIEEENYSRGERLNSAIHIIETLKSMNNTSLSDWKGVITEELDELEEYKIDQKEAQTELLEQITQNFRETLESYESKMDTNNNHLNQDSLDTEIQSIKNQMNLLVGTLSGGKTRLNLPLSKTQKDSVVNNCPFCELEVKYKQRPLINSVKKFKCSHCGQRIISKWASESGFFLVKTLVVEENIKCPICNTENNVSIGSDINSSKSFLCDNCKNEFKVVRKQNNFLIKSITGVLKKIDKNDFLTEEFINNVKSILPSQPWPTGTHKLIAKELQVPDKHVRLAMDELIIRGECKLQINGVIYEKIDTNN